MILESFNKEVGMRNLAFTRGWGLVLCAIILLGAGACCNDCVPRDEFERRMADIKTSGEKMEVWGAAVVEWMNWASPLVATLDPDGDPPPVPSPPCSDPIGCDWGTE